jgi:NAD(P)H-flavin reductase
MMTSLGNIEVTPLASLTFVSFTTGDILYLTGEARTFVGPEAQAIMFRQNVLTTVRITGYTFVRDALPVRQRPTVPVVRSPYSPPVKFLVEESPSLSRRHFDAYATLIKIELLSIDLVVLTYEVKDAINIVAGQAIALDFTDFIGPQTYLHMAPWKPTSVNDDRIRTWTVSSAHVNGATHTFSVTIREKPGGAITGALFMIARKLQEAMPEVLNDTSPLALSARLVGISGEFILPASTSTKLLFIAGGIGVTPFLSMLEASARSQEEREVSLVLASREPEVILPLISKALGASPSGPMLTLDVFSSREVPDMPGTSHNVKLRKHQGRIPGDFFSDESMVGNLNEKEVYLCGPDEFRQNMTDALGIESTRIRTEEFNY